MADKTKISWADATWNMIRARNRKTGKMGWHCEHVTEACRFCYAETMNMKPGASGGTGLPYKPGHMRDLEIILSEKALTQPLRWKRGRKIFPCSMTDLFGDWISDIWLDRIFAVMGLAGQHTFEVLTKRPARMQRYLSDPETPKRILQHMLGEFRDRIKGGVLPPFPFPNIWVGTSVCDQDNATDFIPHLLGTPAALHFISAAPLLGEIMLGGGVHCTAEQAAMMGLPLHTEVYIPLHPNLPRRIKWVLTEGESGKHARPTHPDWFRRLRDDCARWDAVFHHKQNGEWVGGPIVLDPEFHGGARVDTPCGQTAISRSRPFGDGTAAVRVGLKTAGRKLDGVEHNGFPEAA